METNDCAELWMGAEQEKMELHGDDIQDVLESEQVFCEHCGEILEYPDDEPCPCQVRDEPYYIH